MKSRNRVFTYLWQHSLIALLCCSMMLTTACTVDQVLSSIDVALQTAAQLTTAVGAVSPADAALITLLTGLATNGVNAIQTAYDTYEKNKTASNLQNILVAAQTLQTDLPSLLSASHITDPTTVQKVTAWVNLMVACAQGIINEVQALSPTPAPAAVSMSRTAIALTPEAIQAAWQSQVCNGDAACGALVKVHHKHAKWHL